MTAAVVTRAAQIALTLVLGMLIAVNHTVILNEPPTRPVAGLDATDQPLAPTPNPPAPNYTPDPETGVVIYWEENTPEFMRVGKDGEPVRWDRCRPIRYVVNPANQPPGGLETIQTALEEASRTSGFQFEYAGTTTEQPGTYQHRAFLPSLYGTRWSPVLISWHNGLTGEEGHAIVGSAKPESVRRPTGGHAWVTGQISLNAEAFTRWDQNFSFNAAAAIKQATILHEAGHLLGLDHDDRAYNLMYGSVTPKVAEFQPDDLVGLAILADGECMPDL